MRTSILLAALVLATAAPVEAQQADSLILRGQRSLQAGLDAGDPDRLLEARALFERATNDGRRAALAHYYVGRADNELANVLAAHDEDAAVRHLEAAAEHLKRSAEIEETADTYALLATVYGRRISLQPLRGMILGPRANGALERAMKLDPDNPRVLLARAISDFNTPRMWGGSKARALEGLQAAVERFAVERVADPVRPAWGHADAYAWLGIAHMDAGAHADARAAFTKALEVNPEYGWVRHVLLPRLEGEMTTK